MEPAVIPTTAIDMALQLGARAATKLEYVAKPTLKDKKDARDLFKRAAKIMDNAVGLEEEDIYETGPRPDPVPELPAPGVPLNFNPLPPLPADLLTFPGLSPEAQVDAFDALLNEFCDRADVDSQEWVNVFVEDRLKAFTALHVAMREGAEHTSVPTDEEVSAWMAEHEPAPETPAEEEPFELRSQENQQQLFDAALDQLEEAGVEAGQKRKHWPSVETVWRERWGQDRTETWAALQRALESATWETEGGEK